VRLPSLLKLGTRAMNGFDIFVSGEPIEPPLLTVPCCHNTQKPRIVRATTPCLQLFAHARDWCGIATTWTSSRASLYSTIEVRVVDCGLAIGLVHPPIRFLDYDFEVDMTK
jgi:hypothetical protein